MDQHLADLVGVVGLYALFCVVVLEQEFPEERFNDGLGVGQDFRYQSANDCACQTTRQTHTRACSTENSRFIALIVTDMNQPAV